jgi:hypothetical protein
LFKPGRTRWHTTRVTVSQTVWFAQINPEMRLSSGAQASTTKRRKSGHAVAVFQVSAPGDGRTPHWATGYHFLAGLNLRGAALRAAAADSRMRLRFLRWLL